MEAPKVNEVKQAKEAQTVEKPATTMPKEKVAPALKSQLLNRKSSSCNRKGNASQRDSRKS